VMFYETHFCRYVLWLYNSWLTGCASGFCSNECALEKVVGNLLRFVFHVLGQRRCKFQWRTALLKIPKRGEIMSVSKVIRQLLFAVTFTAGLLLGGIQPVKADSAEVKGATKATRKIRENFDGVFKGKTIAYLPITLGLPLTNIWNHVIKKEADELGMKFIMRDPNFDPAVMTQAMSAFIAERPDVLVVQNPSIQLLSKLSKKAEKAGIHVIQINMISNYQTSAFVGADFYRIGVLTARDIVKECGKGSGKSGKIAFVQGTTTSSSNIEVLKGAMSIFNQHPEIKMVSNQPANWNANKAREITATVLKQHPDLCATMGVWGIMQLGAGQAIKEAGLTGKVLNYSSGGGPEIICKSIKAGLMDKYWSYSAELQGHDIMSTAKLILQTGLKPSQLRIALFSRLKVLTKANADNACWKITAK